MKRKNKFWKQKGGLMQDIDSSRSILIRGTQIVIKEKLVKSTAYVMERKMRLLTGYQTLR